MKDCSDCGHNSSGFSTLFHLHRANSSSSCVIRVDYTLLLVLSVKMTGSGHCFVEWKEQFISQERGNRVVHYFLKDSAGESIIAVVGTERSVRHMFYVVAEEFVQVYGAENSIHAGFKWRSRREVVDWLTSMLSKQHVQGDGSSMYFYFSAFFLFSPCVWCYMYPVIDIL